MGKTKYDKFMESAKRDGSLEYSTTQIDYDGYGYGRHYAGMVHVYGFDGEEEFDYIVTQARGKEIIRRLKNGTWWSIPEDIRDNYTTNGYNTRIGIDRVMCSQARQARIAKIADSHARLWYLEGKDGHDARVRMRNNY